MNFVFAQNDEVLTLDLDFCPGIFPEQNPVACHYFDGQDCAVLEDFAGSYGDDFAFLRFFLGAIGNDDSAFTVSFSSIRFINTRSCNGRSFIRLFLFWNLLRLEVRRAEAYLTNIGKLEWICKVIYI